LSELLGGPTLFIKRDDLLGFAAGGNKIRKLEFVVADALEKGADYLITCGAVQSNHCRLTLAAAVREGLKCGLVLEERAPGSYKPRASGNNFLYHLMGVDRIQAVPGGTDMTAAMNAMAAEVQSQGGRPYLIPVGLQAPGCIGLYGLRAGDHLKPLIWGCGSTGWCAQAAAAPEHAGLLTGFWGPRRIPVVGMNVSRPKDQQEELVFKLARKQADLAGIDRDMPRAAVLCFRRLRGLRLLLPTPGMVEAVKLLARTEAILLDPVYTGKPWPA
jgi:D-cysteine desulfhydrase